MSEFMKRNRRVMYDSCIDHHTVVCRQEIRRRPTQFIDLDDRFLLADWEASFFEVRNVIFESLFELILYARCEGFGRFKAEPRASRERGPATGLSRFQESSHLGYAV